MNGLKLFQKENNTKYIKQKIIKNYTLIYKNMTAQELFDSFNLKGKITEQHAKEIIMSLELELLKANRNGFAEAREVMLGSLSSNQK
jgi:hypothetical protein